MVYSGNPDQDIILSLPSSPAITDAGDLFHQPDPLQATTYLIAAERALHHLEYNLPQIHKIFSVFHIPQSDYGVHAGFDEGFMRADLGFLEQIHVFIRSEVHDMPSLLSGLGSIFAPFPAVLFTETSFYDIPVSKVADNAAGSNELVHFSKFINNGTDAHTQPIAICLTRTSESNSPKGFGSGTESNHQNSGNNNKRSTDKQEELDEDEPSNCNKNGVGQGCLASEPSGREGNQANWKADITWDVISEICSSQPGEPRVVSQRLGTKGKVMIERTPEVVEPKQFATCKVHFTDLRFRIDQLTNKMNYGHFYTTVNINSLQKNADIAYFEPKRTLKFTGHSKVMSASKTGLNNTASGTVAAAIAPQPTFGATLGANIAQTRETTTGTEKSTDTSQISVKDMYGAIEWGLCFADPSPYETKGVMVLNVDDLPRVDFTFVGDKDIPAPPPQTMNIEVRTYWSTLPHSGSKNTQRWLLPRLGNKPFYSNICQISVLNVPSDLQKEYYYQATVYVFPQPAADDITVYGIDVRRKANPITVTIGVDHTTQGFNGNETGEWTGNSILSEYPRQLEGGQSARRDRSRRDMSRKDNNLAQMPKV